MSSHELTSVAEHRLATRLVGDLLPYELGSEQRSTMRSRILAACAPPMQVSRGVESEWKAILPGISIRYLHVNAVAGTQLALWRLEPGASIPAHRHTLAEECLVVEGTVSQSGVDYVAGDFLLSAAGSPHDVFVARSGAVLMIRGEIPSIANAGYGLNSDPA